MGSYVQSNRQDKTYGHKIKQIDSSKDKPGLSKSCLLFILNVEDKKRMKTTFFSKLKWL